MKRRIIVSVCLILTLCLSATMTLAETQYCSTCAKRTTFRAACYNIWKNNSAYIQHTVNGANCNYYFVYYKTKLVCITCGNVFDPNRTHTQAEIHSICGGYARCPF